MRREVPLQGHADTQHTQQPLGETEFPFASLNRDDNNQTLQHKGQDVEKINNGIRQSLHLRPRHSAAFGWSGSTERGKLLFMGGEVVGRGVMVCGLGWGGV